MTSALLVIIPFILIFSLVFQEIWKQKKKWAAIHELNRRLEELKKTILVSSSPTIPGKKIEKNLGEISAEIALGISHYSVTEKKALIVLMMKAQERGANAIVEVRRELPPYEVAKKIPLKERTFRLVGKAVETKDLRDNNE
jgi:uncharacterized protein YbjQ (UPF0145 family)